jgi:colanic acid/amylovoran biosynthesis glycosyltransferase
MTPMPPQAPADSIAIIAGSFPSRSETFVYREVRELRRRGWTVHAVSLNEPQRGLVDLRDLEEGLTLVYGGGLSQTVRSAVVDLLTHPLRSAATLATAVADAIYPGESAPLKDRVKVLGQAVAGIRLARRLRRAGVQHLHCHFAHSPATVGMYAARQLGVTFSFVGHANDLFQRRRLLGKKLRRAAFVSCISEWHRDLYRSVEPARDGAYRVIRCGVDAEAYVPGAEGERDGSPLHVLTVCRLVEKKGVDTLIRALADVRTRHGISWRLTIAGDGPQRDDLVALARLLKCDDHIHWLGGVDNTRVPSLMNAADVFAMPCRVDRNGDRDGIPVAMIEAMACGMPVVAGDLPAIRELVRDRETGRLVDGANATATADALVHLANDKLERRRLGDAGRQRVLEEFSLATNVDRLEAALRDAVAAGKRGKDGRAAG